MWKNREDLTFQEYLIGKIGTFDNLKLNLKEDNNLQVCIKNVPKTKLFWDTLYNTLE